MTRDELAAELLAERFGPLPQVIVERQPATERRRRELAEALAPARTRFVVPPQLLPEIRGDVAALSARGFSPEQVAALLGVPAGRVRRVLPRTDDSEDGEAA